MDHVKTRSYDVSPRIYKYSSVLGSFLGPPPPISESSPLSVCILPLHELLKSSWVHLINSQILSTSLLISHPSHPYPPPRTSSFCGCLPFVPSKNHSSRSQPSKSCSLFPPLGIFCPYHGFVDSP